MRFSSCIVGAFFLQNFSSSVTAFAVIKDKNALKRNLIDTPTIFGRKYGQIERITRTHTSISHSSTFIQESTTAKDDLINFLKEKDVNNSPNIAEIYRISERMVSAKIDCMNMSNKEIILEAEATMNFWLQSESTKGAEIITEILHSFEDSRRDLVTSRMYELVSYFVLSIECFIYSVMLTIFRTKAIDAWINSSVPNGPEEADKLLQKYENRESNSFVLETYNYHNVMTALSRKIGKKRRDKRKQKDLYKVAMQVEEILRRMEKLVDDTTKKPNVVTYNICISAYSKFGDGRKAEKLLNEMLKRHLQPDVISYNSVIDSWGRSNEKGSAARAESILNAMKEYEVEPDIISYTGVVFAHTRSDEAKSADNALRILESVEESNLASNEFVYNAVLDAFAKSRQKDKVKKADALLSKMISKGLANNVSFNAVLNCYAKSATSGAGSSAEALLERMEQSDEYKPDVISYTCVIDALTKSRNENAAERAQKILERMLKFANEGDVTVQPNAITYNTVINTWASSGRPDAAEKAEELLKRMEKIYESGECKKARPNTISYTSVIDAYARSKSKNNALDAERVFKRMEQKYTEGNENAKPNVHSFNTGKYNVLNEVVS
jgi:pentatricopeptide repeat protein